jgi:SAM-dependent methyltransferase
MRDPKERFTDRVEDYVAFRPRYPRALLELLVSEWRLGSESVVVDVGSGTGIFSRLLLESGARVVGVEPNAAMRAAAERDLAGEARFTSVDGGAEATGQAAASCDLVTAAQAFHWFDPPRARAEFRRIVRPGGGAALVWNMRRATPFNDEYEEMLERLAPEYPAVRARDRAAEGAIARFFSPATPREAHFPNAQELDEAGLRGRLLSSSYAPKPGDPNHGPILAQLAESFARHAKDGRVVLAYDTVVYWAPLS